ncbi:CoF synthetase [Marinobacter sp. JSM 1782161]|uniref:CoF synthetase n=1 Tax=Marinobacter sp. JSM 1782161 TaxID=2685906 RepID=UPI001402A122|nr:CoF synthetase [Marinobacter sp. JSM 1782161]
MTPKRPAGVLENMAKRFRFYLTRLFFRVLGIDLERRYQEVATLWSLGEHDRRRMLDKQLRDNKPLNAEGQPIDSLEGLRTAPVMGKKSLGKPSTGRKAKGSFSRHTAGTTGDPTHVELDTVELARMLGVREYCFRHYGVRLGMREARLWGRPNSGIKNRVRDFVLNRRVFHPVGDHATDAVIAMLKWKPDYVYGYASLILEAARILKREKIRPTGLSLVVCTAETVLPSQKRFIEESFNCKVAEEYGATEFDIVAFECRSGHRHLVNPWLVVETNDLQELLITDVARASQDVARYRIGDIGEVSGAGCQDLGDNLALMSLEGRALNRFAYGEGMKKFHAVEFAKIMDAYMAAENRLYSFSIEQHEVGIVAVTTEPKPDDQQHLCEFVERQLFKRCSVSMTVEWRDTSLKPRAIGKNGYFSQYLNAEGLDCSTAFHSSGVVS